MERIATPIRDGAIVFTTNVTVIPREAKAFRRQYQAHWRIDYSSVVLMITIGRVSITGYPVLRDGQLVGLVTLDDARDIREVERDAYRVSDVMTSEVRTIGLEADATEALTEMQRHGIGRLPVVDYQGELVGILSRSDLLTALTVIRMGGSPPTVTQEPILGSMRPPKETSQQ